MNWKVKITPSDITYGPKDFDLDPTVVFTFAGDLAQQGYRRTSNAFCIISRIDREDWLDVLATSMRTCVANFYNKDGSGVSDRWRDHYVRVYSKDKLTVSPSILRKIPPYF